MIRKSQLDSLTGLRFIAALAVFNLHFLDLDNWFDSVPAAILSIVDSGHKGVTLFFMLSGFILAYAYSDIARDSQSRIKFWINRLARIYPVYLLGWLWTAPFYLAHRFATEPAALAMQKALGSGAASLVLLQSWIHPRLAIAWNGPGWTLSVEAFFYLAFPFAAISIRKLSRPWLIAMAVTMMATAGALTYGAALMFGPTSTIAMYANNHPLPNLPIFLAGVALGYHFLSGGITQRLADVCFVSGAILCLFCAALPVDSTGMLAHHFGFLPGVALVIYGVANGGGPSALLASKPMVRLGEASYSLYILQFAIAATIEHGLLLAIGANGANQVQRSPLYFLALLVVMVAISLLVYRKVESPMRIRVQKYLNARLAPTSPSVAASTLKPSA